ncbi:hypothetical protein K458DRAFT_435927 [Lentithecium fluviatile CBS 122367]|uniref:Transcription factor domain-containing protein n=1 Tax=Lentithecium fluviatile CBS 122367 TaxID=1168545 RepID=A0A6G1IKH6_9PLEO|nr:hypothetical protein K458DRAFT_435927 [Lentithecium fluviatile CBS 122367]
MAAPKPPGLHFLVSTSVEKPDPDLRKFIRRHVMLGKNRRKARPAGRRTPKVAQCASSLDTHIPPSDFGASSGDSAVSSISSTTVSSSVFHFVPVTVPSQFGYHMSSIHFPDAVEPCAVEVVLQFSSIAKQILFPLEPCILFEGRAEAWIIPLTFDPAFLHSMIFTTRSYYDVIVSGKCAVTQATMQHFLRALELLRERMGFDGDQTRLSDATLAAIMSIASHALLTGDYDSARNHIKGLCKIVKMRGGVKSFQHNRKLFIEILRCDIGMALHTGSRPVFFREASSQECLLQYPDLSPLLKLQPSTATASQLGLVDFLGDIDNEIFQAWKVMADFCSIVNFAQNSKQFIPFRTLADTMASTMYRLIGLNFAVGSNNEAIRLGLLAFSTSVFLQWRFFGLTYAHSTSEFRSCLTSPTSSQLPPQLMLWLLMVGAVSVYDGVGEEGLKQSLLVTMDLCEIDSWNKMEHLLNSFMWIGCVQDKTARSVFNAIVSL